MKHWTEPNGIFLIQLPIEWRYANPALENVKEEPPYGFYPYENAIGCLQISCYPLATDAPKLAKAYPNGVPKLSWQKRWIGDDEFSAHMFYGALADQVLIGKYIYPVNMEKDAKVKAEYLAAEQILNSIIIVPLKDRKLASDLDKFDRFLGSLAASFDLLYCAIDAKCYIEIIALSANQIDAFLRLSIVLAIQVIDQTNDIEIKYLYQRDDAKGIMERRIFDDALNYGVIEKDFHKDLNSLYELRNRVIHRYIISDIKTRDLLNIVGKYLEVCEITRLILRDYEQKQLSADFGIYGGKFGKLPESEEIGLKRYYADLNDKHLLDRFKRRIG